MVKKISTLALSFAMISMVAGCGQTAQAPSGEDATTTPPAATVSTEPAKTDENMPVLRIGVDDTYPPMEFIEETGKEMVGFDIDFGRAVAEEMGMVAEFESTNWDSIFIGLKADKYDCIISSVSITPARQQEFNLTDAYIENNIVIVTAPDNTTIKGPDDLEGNRVAVQTQTTADDYCKELLEKGAKFEHSEYDTVQQAFEELKLGRVDAVAVDVVVAKYYILKDPSNYQVAWESPEGEPIGVCIKKDNTELYGKFQTAIKTLKANGKIAEIAEKWFGDDISAK